VELGEVDEAALLGEVEDVFEGPAFEGVCEVDDGAGRRGERNAAVRRDIARLECPRAMKSHSSPSQTPGMPCDADVDGTRAEWSQIPCRRGGRMTKNATRREHGRHPTALDREDAVTDGEHPAMKAVEPPDAHAAVDGGLAQAEAEQLRSRYDAVLTGC
jgi:hypothetical protein